MSFFFFFNDTATTEIYTLSLHDALPIYGSRRRSDRYEFPLDARRSSWLGPVLDRKSTRLNSSHLVISYAVFCLKKKKYKTLALYFIDHLTTKAIPIPHSLLHTTHTQLSL